MWSYPGQNQDPWYDSFESMVLGIDASSYASREDRSLIFTGGGTFSFTASSGVLAWSAPIDIFSAVSGSKISIAAGSATLTDGQVLYVNVTRAPSGNVSASAQVAGSVPNTDNAYILAVRSGTFVFFRTGHRIEDGETKSLYATGIGTSGQHLVSTAWAGAKTQHSNIISLVVGLFSFDPDYYDLSGASLQVSLRAVGKNLGTSAARVKLYNVTDAADVAEISFISTTTHKAEALIDIGASPGQIPSGERIYRVETYSAVASSDVYDVYSMDIRAINTVD